jgi:uncharacterized protein YuzE
VRITFDSSVDALTFVVSDADVAQTVEVGDRQLVDLDADGNVVAVEVFCASKGLNLHELAERFDLEPLLGELAQQVKQARNGIQQDPKLREVLAAH